MPHALRSVPRSIGWHTLLAVPVLIGSAAAAIAAVPQLEVTTQAVAELPADQAATAAPPFVPGKNARQALARYMFPDGRIDPRVRCVREAACVIASRP